jgi:hypothetical protein
MTTGRKRQIIIIEKTAVGRDRKKRGPPNKTGRVVMRRRRERQEKKRSLPTKQV